jgi:hypothetical protein
MEAIAAFVTLIRLDDTSLNDPNSTITASLVIVTEFSTAILEFNPILLQSFL